MWRYDGPPWPVFGQVGVFCGPAARSLKSEQLGNREDMPHTHATHELSCAWDYKTRVLKFHSLGIHEHPRVKHVSVCFIYIYIIVQNDTMCDVRK